MPPALGTGAQIMCTFGLAPAALVGTPATVMIEGVPATDITSIAPGTNVPPFGMCTSLANPTVAAATAAALGVLTPMPCLPVLTPWVTQSPTVLVAGKPSITMGAQCTCAYGGVIMATNPGTTKTMIG